ncbi:SwmB domain-containing protein [Synechocystis sp. LEGE 06083]|uniref:Calx-beta domain-containing protein n=1 Tax=Synechocystis sp. LEGE 06083 TaxID=915336 RepID=UPI001D14DAD7|nr:SwmB domain-containing protein [Synechocystis sp. LEGE 06083]
MSINLSNRLSAVVQDSAGTSHIVWLEGTNIWHAVYDPVSQTWKNAQAIVDTAGQHIRSLNLVADSGLIVESGTSNNTLIPGLAVVYQEGRENDSNFFYTAAQYDTSGKLQWLDTPQALTADQVGDLEPRVVVDNGFVTVVGQKVDLIKAQNQAIREDADLYSQTFQIYSNQFPTTPPAPVTPIAAYTPQISKNGVIQGNYIVGGTTTTATLANANYQPFTQAEAQSAFQGFGANWSVSQTFDTNLSNLQFLKGMPVVPQFLLEPIFKKFNLSGTLLGSSGNNPNLSFFGGGISTEGLLLNASMAVQLNEADSDDPEDSSGSSSASTGGSLNPAQNTTNLTFKPETSFSFIAATLYTFDQKLREDSLSYPLTVETGSVGLTAGLTIPLPISGTPLVVDFLGSIGAGFQWQLSPKDPQTYFSPVSVVLSPMGDGTDASILSTLIGVPPLGALAAVGLAVISDIAEIVELIFSDFDPDSNEALELESLLFSTPVAAGIDGGIKIPVLFEALVGIQVSLVGTAGGTRSANSGAFQPNLDISLGLPMNITIKTLGFLGGTVGFYPYWTWGDDLSSSDTTTLNQATFALPQTSNSPTAIVKGSLLEIQGLQTNGTPQATDFQVNVKDPLGQTTTIPVFGVLTRDNTTILRLESAIPQTALNDQPFSKITVSYQNKTPIPVVNQSANTFTYNYNPISGTGSNYQVTDQQVIVAFNATLNPNITPDLSRFQVTDANGNLISINSVSVAPRSVVLTLSGNSSSTYSVNYSSSSGSGNVLTTEDNVAISDFNIASNTPPNTAGQVNRTYSNVSGTTGNTITTNPLLGSTVAQDYAEDSPPALAVTNDNDGVLLAWSSDTPPITPISALLSGTQIFLTFADTLQNPSNTKATSNPFTVLINNQSAEIQDSSSSDNYVKITLNSSTVINADDTISVSYSIDSTPENSLYNLYLSDATDFALWVPDFTTPVTQAASSTNAPTLLEAVAISNVITLTFDQLLSSSNSPGGNQFIVTVNNSNNFITVNDKVDIENNSVILPLLEPIGQGDIVTVSYISGDGILANSNNIPVAPFTTSDILTTFTNPGTVIKTLLATPSTSSVSIAYPSSIIGTSGLNYDPAVYFDQATNQVFAAWVNVDSSQIQNQLIPGQYYSNLEIITQALQSSTIYFSVASLDDLGDLGPNAQIIPWSVAAPIPQQTGQNTNVTLGLGPDGSIMAAWLNTILNNNGTPVTTIYYSKLNSSSGWSEPARILPDINPDPFTPLTISTINQQPAIFWTESAPASYRQLVRNADPSVYLRLGERTGTVARNSGQFQAAANGTYSGTFTLGEMGALETTSNSGDPNPAVLFQGGGVTLNQPVPLTNNAFAIEFWFKLPNLPQESINLVSAPGLFGLGLDVDPNDPNAPPKLTFGLGNDDDTQIQASETLATDLWYYVVGTYDGSSQNLSLYLNGVLAGTVDDVEFDSFPTSAALTLAGASTENNPVYLDEVAFYPKALTASDVNAGDLTSPNFQNLTGSQILEIIAGTNQIGNHYAAQYNKPIPPGPNTYYSVLDGSSWQLPSQINPTPAIVPTQLAGANIPVFDLVSATAAQASTMIAPNGIADAVYQISLSNPNLTISGIKVTSGNQAWAIGTDNTGTALTGNQLGLLLGDTLLNSLNHETSTFSYPIQGYTENLFLFIDPGSSNTPLGAVDYTVYFDGGNTIGPTSVAPYQINSATMGPGQTVTGTATVTEANDSSLALIDSGFIIDSDNPAIGYVLASAFNSDGSLAYVAVGNRGYSDSQGNLGNNGTVQILFGGSDILSGSGSLSTNDLNGNPDGVLITNIQDAGDNNRNLSLSLATGDIDGDGIPDLVIGAPNVGKFAGAVYVIYGSYLNSQKGQKIDVTSLSTTPNSMGFAINGSNADDLAGFSVVVGNFDGDDYDDIVFGAPYGKDSDGNRVGLVYLVPGFAQDNAPDSISPTVIYTGQSFEIPNPQPNPPSPTLTVGEGAGFALGVSRRLTGTNSPSTFTGSTTTDDLFIGAPNYQIQVANQWTNQSNLPGQNSQNKQNQQITSDLFPSSSYVSAGAVYVYNSNQGLSLNTNPWAIYTGPAIPNAQGTATSYFAGSVIGSGLNMDLDGDGRQDLVIAGPGANTNTGQAFVIAGSTATPSVTTTITTTTTPSGTTTTTTTITPANPATPTTSSVTTTTTTTTPTPTTPSGTTTITTTNTQTLNTVSNLVINGGLAGGKTGAVITSPGDLNDDGYQDFLITAPQGANATGQSYVLFGPLDLSQFGTIFDLNVTANDNKTTFLLNGNQPFQATGTAGVGVGDINNDGIDDIMLTAPLGQQLYAVYGHPWLADDGSIKLADVSSNNGFVIDGYQYSLATSPFGYVLAFALIYNDSNELVTAELQMIAPNGEIVWQTTDSNEESEVTPEAYAIMQSDGNLVIYGQPAGDIIWASGTNGNDGAVLKLASDGGLYIVDPQNNIVTNGTLNSANPSLISTAVTLNENQEITTNLATFLLNGEIGYLLVFVLVQNEFNQLVSAKLQLISATGELVWQSNPGEGVKVTSEAYAIMQSDGNLVIYGQPGGNSGDVIWASGTNGNDGAVLKLASDGGLYIVDPQNNIVPNGTLNSGNISLISTATTLNIGEVITTDVDTFLLNSETAGSLFGNGRNVVMLGDINGDGFADVLSGGSSAGGVVVFGNSTKDLLDAAVGTDDLLISIDGAEVKEFVALGDFNGDGLADFGVIDSNNNFYTVLGDPSLGTQGNLELNGSPPNITNVTQAWAVGDVNGDGYGDVVLQIGNQSQLYWGNVSGELAQSINIPVSAGYPGSFTGIDINGDGANEIVVGQPTSNPVSNIGGFQGSWQYFSYESNSLTITSTLTPPNTPISQPLAPDASWTQYSLSDQATNLTTSLAILDGWLYQAYFGTNGGIFLQRTRDGVNWQDLTELSTSTFDAKYPASIAAFNGSLYLGFTDNNQQVWVAEGTPIASSSSNPIGLQFNSPIKINQASNNGPTLVAFNNELYVFFIENDSDDYILYTSSTNPGSDSDWSGNTTLTINNEVQASDQPLSATVMPGENGIATLAVAYKAKGQSYPYTATITPDSPGNLGNWQVSSLLTQAVTGSQPSLIAVDGTYYLFFANSNERDLEYITSTDGINWDVTETIIGSSTDLVGVSSALFNQSFILSQTNKNNNGFNFVTSKPFFESNQAINLGQQVYHIGDFNGDGLADLAVLAPGYRNLLTQDIIAYNGINNLGGVFIYYGDTNGIASTASPDVVLAAPDLPSETNFALLEITAIGDMNGDGFDDVLISSPLTTIVGSQNSSANGAQGVNWVVFGGTHWGSQYNANSPFGLGKLAENQSNSSQNFNPYGFVTTGLPGSQAGISISGGADVNGDGFSDFIMGAPGALDNLSYVLFGSDFTSQVNQMGTIGDDVMLGTPTGEIFIAGQGDDIIYTNGGVDVVYAGPGDDLVTVSDTNFRRLDGGSGTDTLKLTGYNGQAWDLTTLSPGLRLRNFEIIDIRNYGANNLTLNSLTVVKLSGNNQVTVLMDANDTLNLSADFEADGTEYRNSQKYYKYTSKISAAVVLVNQPQTITFNADSTNKPILNTIPTAQPLDVTSSSNSQTNATQNLASASGQATRLFVSNPKVSEASGEAQFVVERTGDLDKYVLVSYITQDMSGKAGDRYLPIAGQLIFNPGENQKTVTVKIPNDFVYTGDRQFGLLVSLLNDGLEAGDGDSAFALAGDANGAQIRRWNYLAGDWDNSVMNGLIDFSTTVNSGQAQINLSVEGLVEFNDFFSYDPLSQTYQSLIFNDETGARFTNLDNSNGIGGVELKLLDGDRGDADGIVNGLVATNGYVCRTIPGLISNNNRVFWAPTNADGQVQLRLINSPSQNYEIGWVPVDSADGAIDGLLPDDPGYEEAALARKQVVFSDQANASAQALTRSLARQSFTDIEAFARTESQFFGSFSNSNLEANRYYMLYSQQGEEIAFSIDAPLMVETDSRGYHQLDFNGITTEIASKTLVVPGILNQTVTANVSISRAGAYENLIVLYKVDSLTGGIDTDGDRQINLNPGDGGYLQAALTRAQNPATGLSLNAPDEFFSTTQKTITLSGNNMYGMAIIPNSSIEEVLSKNPTNNPTLGPVALFSFGAANPGGISHMSRLGSNLFGFEDIVGGGDLDYNDVIIEFSYKI